MKKIGIILLVLVLLALAGGMIFCIVKISSNEKDVSVTALNFVVGNIDAEGDFNKNDTSTMVTKNFLKLEGLSIELPEDSTVQYKVFYYDKEGSFLSAQEAFSTETYSATAPEGATQCKIVVDPLQDAEVSFFEISKYAKQITIKVNK